MASSTPLQAWTLALHALIDVAANVLSPAEFAALYGSVEPRMRRVLDSDDGEAAYLATHAKRV